MFYHFWTFPDMRIIAPAIRLASTLARDKIHNWSRVPHYNVLCIGSSSHGKTKLAHKLSGLTYEDLARQSGSLGYFSAEEKTTQTVSTCFVEYEFNNLHFAHLDTPGDFYSKNLTAAYSAFDILIWVINKNIGLETTDHLLLAKNLCPDFAERTCVYLVDQNLDDVELGALFQEEIDATLNELNIPPSNVASEFLNNIQDVLTQIAKLLSSFGHYRSDDLAHLPIERSFSVSGVGQIAVGVLKGNKNWGWKPKMNLDLVTENRIVPVEMIQTGMFYKNMKQSEVGDRVNCLLRSKVNKFGKFVNRGAVLVPEGYGVQYHKDEISFTPELDLSTKYTRAAAHSWNVNITQLDKSYVKIDKKLFIRPGDKLTFFAHNKGFQTVTVI